MQKSDPLVVRKISNGYLIAINEFCECDDTIVTSKRRQDSETFRYDFQFGWFRNNELLHEIGALNSEAVKAAMKRFFQTAHDQLTRFQFVGLYFARDIHAWVKRVEEDLAAQEAHDNGQDGDDAFEGNSSGEYRECNGDDNALPCEGRRGPAAGGQSMNRFYDTVANNLPFGVIPLGFSEKECYGHYQLVEDRVAMTRTLQFVAADKELEQLYDFHVVDLGARFIPVTSEHYQFAQMARDHNELIPLTPFATLYIRASLLNEAETQVYDYNAMQVYKDEYAIAIPEKEKSPDQIVEPNLHSVDTLLGLNLADARQREDAALENARTQLERNQMRRSMYSTLQNQSAPRVPTGLQRVAQFNRPTRADFLQYIPKSVEMSSQNGAPPSYNLQELRQQYEMDVCSVMALPYLFLKPYAQDGGQKGLQSRNDPSSKLDFSQKLMDDESRRQHDQFDLLFKEMYMRTLRHLDHQVLGGLAFYDELQPGVQFEMVSAKTDDQIKGLLEYYTAGVLDPVIIRRFLYRSLGIDDDPEKAPPPLPAHVLQEKQLKLQEKTQQQAHESAKQQQRHEKKQTESKKRKKDDAD